MQLIVILGIIVAIGGVAFALQNQVTVTVVFLLWRFDSSLAMVILLAIALGAAAVALASLPARMKSRWATSRLRKDLDKAETTRRELARRLAELEAAANAKQAEGFVAKSDGPSSMPPPTHT